LGIIFDLDQTLINSMAAEPFRSARNWSAVYPMIPTLAPYEGVPNLLNELNQMNIPYCIVTSSPSPYCNRIIKHWGWKTHSTVCFHDTKLRKPNPEPILLGIEKLGLTKDKIVSIGDDPRDIIASKRAGVISIGVTWGTQSYQELLLVSPDFLFNTVADLHRFLLERFT
jgi:phosphoglycolate phosphatase-like HAD superfamily hydrolase